MPKLRLKRTREEEEERERKRARKASRRERKTKRRQEDDYEDLGSSSHRGDPGPSTSHHRNTTSNAYAASSNSKYGFDEEAGDEAIRERLEQERFEEKMRDALEEDGLYDPTQRLDGVEARFNSYTHIPRRWRGTGGDFSAGVWMEDAREDIGIEPEHMNDDEYAEYMRAGMWR